MKISPDRKVDSTWKTHDGVNVYKTLVYKLKPLRKAKEKKFFWKPKDSFNILHRLIGTKDLFDVMGREVGGGFMFGNASKN